MSDAPGPPLVHMNTTFAAICVTFNVMDSDEETPFFSIIIPNHNGEKTIGLCLNSIFSRSGATDRTCFEVIVVDDCSTDGSVGIIEQHPCRLFCLDKHSGASKARNQGAQQARGEVLLFIDSDCLLTETTLEAAGRAYKANPDAITGGTYTREPYDKDFFSRFQSVFINHFETSGVSTPTPQDYIATHSLIIKKELFNQSNGFMEDFLPMIEDVDFCHRMRAKGVELLMDPSVLVTHVFNFNLWKSLKNAFKKSMYWTVYSMKAGNLHKPSGTSSTGLKVNALCALTSTVLLLCYVFTGNALFVAAILVLLGVNVLFNTRFLETLFASGGVLFQLKAVLYYMTVYPLSALAGAASGAWLYLSKYRDSK